MLVKLDDNMNLHGPRIKIGPHLSPYTTLYSKWAKDPNIRPDTLHLIEEKVANPLELIGTGKDFLNRTLIAGMETNN